MPIDPNFYPIIATILLSLVSFAGVCVIPFQKFKSLLPLLVSLAAGTMIGDVFLHLIPHTIEEHKDKFDPNSLVWIIVGISLFYLLETVLHWHHNHSSEDIEKPHYIAKISLLGDAFHNFFDGLGIAVAFAVNPAVGIATTFAFMLHEIPQEIGDFAILINSGWSRKKALLANFGTALTAIFGSIVGIFAVESFESLEQPIVMLTAGSLIYIALADLIPQGHNHRHFKFAIFASFIVGVTLMYGLGFVEGLLEIS
jgi:zinc and cadmium transporter